MTAIELLEEQEVNLEQLVVELIGRSELRDRGLIWIPRGGGCNRGF